MPSAAAVHPERQLERDGEDVCKRRPSLNSLGAKYTLKRLHPKDAQELMPHWLHVMLVAGGGCTGSEHVVIKCLVVLSSCVYLAVICLLLWLVGVPVPTAVALFVILIAYTLMLYDVRWQFLQSGVLWSLAQKLDSEGQILGSYPPISGVR